MFRRSTWLSAALPLIAAALCVSLFFVWVQAFDLNGPMLRAYGGDWFDHIPGRELQLFVAVAFFGSGATLFGALFFAKTFGRRLEQCFEFCLARPKRTVAVLAALAVLAAYFISKYAIQHAPLTDDEQIYRFQVSLLKDGLLRAKEPPSREPFVSQFLVYREGTWTGIYPWGHIALLAGADALGSVYLWPHLSAGLAVVLTALLARELFPRDRSVVLLGAALVATSPFLAFTSATLHNVTSSIVFVTAGALFLARSVRVSPRLLPTFFWAIAAGLAFSVALHIRPFNAMMLGAAEGLLALLVLFFRSDRARERWIGVGALSSGFLVGLIPGIWATLAINQFLSGDPMQSIATLEITAKGRHVFGFHPQLEMAYNFAHTPVLAFGKSTTNLLRFSLWSSGTPLMCAGFLALLLGVRRKFSDTLLVLPIVSFFFGYYFFFTSPVYDTGPIYYLDLVPLFAIGAARAASSWIGERNAAAYASTDGTSPQQTRAHRVIALLATGIIVAGATFWSSMAMATYHVSNVILSSYRAVEKANVSNAIVWWSAPPGRRSWVMTRKLPRYDLTDDVIFAKDVGRKMGLVNAFPKRKHYIIRYPDGLNAQLFRWFPPQGLYPQRIAPLDAPEPTPSIIPDTETAAPAQKSDGGVER